MFLQGNDAAGKMIRADMEKLGVSTELVQGMSWKNMYILFVYNLKLIPFYILLFIKNPGALSLSIRRMWPLPHK